MQICAATPFCLPSISLSVYLGHAEKDTPNSVDVYQNTSIGRLNTIHVLWSRRLT